MCRLDPLPVEVTDLVVQPHERPPRRIPDKRLTLPVQRRRHREVGLVEVHDCEPRHREKQSDHLIGVLTPRRRPHHLTPQPEQPRPQPTLHHRQLRITPRTPPRGIFDRRRAGPSSQWDHSAIDVEKYDRARTLVHRDTLTG